MLTCVNPNVSFSADTSKNKVSGVAICLSGLYNLITMSGNTPPPDTGSLRQEIETLEIGVTKNAKQFFNKTPNGTKITRTRRPNEAEVEVISKKCIITKHSAFGVASWAVFSEGSIINFEMFGSHTCVQYW